LGKGAGELGISQKFATAMQKVANIGKYGVAAYQAVKNGKYEDLALALLGKVAPDMPQAAHIKNAVNIYHKAKGIADNLKNGNELGAITAFAGMAGDFVNDGSKMDRFLDNVNKIGGDVQAVEKAVKQKDWTQVADILMKDAKKYTNLNDDQLKDAYTAVRLADSLNGVRQSLQQQDWIGAGLAVADAGNLLATDEKARNLLLQARENMGDVKEVFDAIQDNRHDKALAKLNTMFGKPIPAGQLLDPAIQARENVQSIEQSIRARDYDGAAEMIMENLGDRLPMDQNSKEMILRTLEVAETVNHVVDKVKNADLAGYHTAFNHNDAAAGATSVMDFGERIRLIQGLRTSIAGGRYHEAINRANLVLGKSWDADQWMQKLDGSVKGLARIEQAVEQKDWRKAANLALQTLGQYMHIDGAVSTDVNRLAQLFSSLEVRFAQTS
jgi:hypothetical protein